MKISHQTDYALKTLLDLAVNRGQKVVPIAEIARRQDIPPKFLEQILLTLKKAGFVTSKRGPSGGYFLVRKPEEVTIGAVVRLFEGYLAPITCVSKSCYTHCNYEEICPFREVWEELREVIASKLDGLNLSDMVRRHETLVSSRSFSEYII